MTIAKASADIDERTAYILNARHELSMLRSEIKSGLGDTPNDYYLKAAFLAAVDDVDLNLKKALR